MEYANRRRLIWAASISLLAVLVAVALVYATTRTSISDADDQTGLPSVAGNIYMGLTTLEERIAGSEVVARVELLSGSQGIEPVNDKFSPALIFRFRVLEYLKATEARRSKASRSRLGDTRREPKPKRRPETS